ncbi:methyltransferase domain-containing protein [Parvularcula dongshanensis]|uniref:SAM-dependent methyltransferase n=1 Tax=Parvularcula dongshanensis TaxID=1173995 RepID=A0A840I6L5_9PROT|nr:methyltransferase domain-containing protein [Parvularcula dongshanensis]MBB4659883.1 SAM-dependent methyltransferase [Parvularcula dongshanensis]
MPGAIRRDYGARAAPQTLPERMDGETDYETFRATLSSLASVNRLTSGYAPIRAFLDQVLERGLPERPLRLLDLGSGYGDGLRAAARYLSERGVRAELTGVDLNPHAAMAAREAQDTEHEGVTISYVTADVFDYAQRAPQPDLVTCALFTHHLEDEEVVRLLSWMDRTASRGWLVNDLYRSRVAAAGFRVLSTLLGKHPYVRHDGPVSFARSFRRADWDRYLSEAKVEGARIFIGAPFRLCVEKHA